MSAVGFLSSGPFVRRKPPHRIIIAHGENVRSFSIRPWLIGIVAGATAIFGILYLAATGYLVFRDDLLAASIARQSRMQRAYEDRIAGLRADIDRLTSRQLLNQEAVEAEVDKLSGRQAALDARQDSIAGLSQAARAAGIDPTDVPPPDATAAGNDAADVTDDNEDNSASDSEPDATAAPAPAAGVPGPQSSIAPTKADAASLTLAAFRPSAASATDDAPDPTTQLSAINGSLDSLARDQVAYVDTIASRVSHHTDQIADILKTLGVQVPPGHSSTADDDAIGGPLADIAADVDPGTFRSSVELITAEIDRYGAVRRLAGQIPLTRPIADAAITSGYGARLDPFLGRPAMHTGVDFRAPLGSAARATAGGTVITAAYTGGYGNMVEIDHGNGITTRYGHLSEIDVTVGQVVAKGAVIGQTGSTGRSTGPHLHYEVRVDGAPIDPMVYIKAGRELAAFL